MLRSLFCLIISMTTIAYASDSRLYSDSPEAISVRIAPVGQVNIKSDGAPAPAPAETVVAKKVPHGEEIYNKYCVVCHSAGVAGAPKAHDKDAWAPRMKVGLDNLVASAIKGKNAMPPKGTCAECTPEDIRAAIEFMQPKSDG